MVAIHLFGKIKGGTFITQEIILQIQHEQRQTAVRYAGGKRARFCFGVLVIVEWFF